MTGLQFWHTSAIGDRYTLTLTDEGEWTHVSRKAPRRGSWGVALGAVNNSTLEVQVYRRWSEEMAKPISFAGTTSVRQAAAKLAVLCDTCHFTLDAALDAVNCAVEGIVSMDEVIGTRCE